MDLREATTGRNKERVFGPPILVDTHVHFHRLFDTEAFLGAAKANFGSAATKLALGKSTCGVLILTRGLDEWSLRDLRTVSTASHTSPWSYEATAEDNSLLALYHGQVQMLLVAGRQLRTAEALEVLAVGSDADLPHDCPIDETLEAVRASGALPVVPWGFGKWWGRRGRVLDRLLETQPRESFFLGDNGGRPRAFPRPRFFKKAAGLGIRDLPGSDPLPFAREVARPGSCGFIASGALDRQTPSVSLLSLLSDPGFQPESFGEGEMIFPFLRKQVGMQLHKRRRG